MTADERAAAVLGDRDCWPDEAWGYAQTQSAIAAAIREAEVAAAKAERGRCAQAACAAINAAAGEQDAPGLFSAAVADAIAALG